MSGGINKTLNFMLKLDTTDIDGQIDKIKRKLSEAYRPGANAQNMQQTQQRLEGMGIVPPQTGPQGKAAQEAYQKSANQAKVNLDKQIAAEFKAVQDLNKEVAKKTVELQKNMKIQEQATKGTAGELELQKQILATRENIRKANEQIAARTQVINEAADARAKLSQGKFGKAMEEFRSGRGGGIEGLITSGGNMSTMAMVGLGVGVTTAVVAAIAKAAQMVGNAYVAYGRIPMEVSQARGSAMQNTYGGEVAAQGQGTQAQEMMFLPEKREAAEEAKRAQETKLRRDEAFSIHGQLSKTQPGDLFGQAQAILTGAFGDVINSGSLKRDIARYAPGDYGKEKRAEYQAQNIAELAENYNKTKTAKIQQNPYKTQAANYFSANREGNLGFERGVGMSDQDFTGQGGFLEQNANAGFTQQQAMGMSQGILGAGGSTRMARDSMFANKMARDHDLTNAGQVTGTLSGVLGGSKETEQATIKILAEGMRLGLNAADMTEENRKFTQTVADIAAKSGSQSPEDVMDKAAQFSRFMGNNTMMGISGAQGAFEQYQERSKSTSGAYGVLQASAFLSNKTLSSLDPKVMSSLMELSDADINPDNPRVRAGFAEASKKDPSLTMENFIGNLHKAKETTQSRDPDTDNRIKRIRDYMKKNNITKMDRDAYKNITDKGIQQDINMVAVNQSVERPGMSAADAESGMYGAINGAPGTKTKEQQEADERRLGIPGQPRQGDQANAADAASQKDVLKSFRQFHDILVPTVEAVEAFNKALRKGVADAQGTPQQQRIFNFANDMINMANKAQNQPQSGSGKGDGE